MVECVDITVIETNGKKGTLVIKYFYFEFNNGGSDFLDFNFLH